MPPLTKTAIVSIDQLPKTPDTLWIRLLGRGLTQEIAIHEILALPIRHPRRMPILRLLASWKVRIELTEIPNRKERDEFMAFTQAFLEWEQKTEERGWLQGHQIGQEEGNRSLLSLQLSQRFGPLPDSTANGINLLALDRLEALAIAIFSFADRADLEAWLTQTLASQLMAGLTTRLGTMPESLQEQLKTASLDRLLIVAQTEPIGDFKQLIEILDQRAD